MRTAFVTRNRVQLVYDHIVDAAELLAKTRRGQQNEERLGRRDQDLRRKAQHRGAVAGRCVAGAESGANRDRFQAHRGRDLRDPGERLFKIDPDVVGERF